MNPAKIRTFRDFAWIPPVNRDNYLYHYPVSKLLWDGKLGAALTWSSSSGSMGHPLYVPRSEMLNAQYSILVQLFLENDSRQVKGPTLVVVGFGMGVWIAGLLTYRALEIANRRMKRSVSIVTPGTNKEEILHIFATLAPHFAEIVLVGYPPFVKDIIDEAPLRGIDLKKLRLRLMFAAESFSEPFRNYVVEEGHVRDLYLDTTNVYGSTEFGGMAIETPASILVRRLASRNKHLSRTLFPITEKTPTVAQYNPFSIVFEAVDREMLLTGDGAMPLVRYAVGDHGAAFSAAEARESFAEHGISFQREARRTGVPLYELPFVCVYERSDFSTKLYGAIVYPEHVREGLVHKDLHRSLTGKCAIATRFNKANDEYLEVNVEMKRGVKPSARLAALARRHVTEVLLRKNSEYRNSYHAAPRKVTPIIVLWQYGDPRYFKPVGKQRWVIKA